MLCPGCLIETCFLLLTPCNVTYLSEDNTVVVWTAYLLHVRFYDIGHPVSYITGHIIHHPIYLYSWLPIYIYIYYGCLVATSIL